MWMTLRSMPGVSNLSSRRDLCLWNCLSCPLSRRISFVTIKGDYAMLALRNYKMIAENLYSYLIIVKLLTPFRFLKHSQDSLKTQFVIYEAITACIIAVYVLSLKLSAIIVYLAQYFHSASGYPTSMKPVTYQQEGRYVIILQVQAIHYIIWLHSM